MIPRWRSSEDFMGDVIGDLNSRRGQIQAMDERSGARVVRALVIRGCALFREFYSPRTLAMISFATLPGTSA